MINFLSQLMIFEKLFNCAFYKKTGSGIGFRGREPEPGFV